MKTTAELVEVIHNPEHWNANCGCMIPEAWEALVDTGEYLDSLGRTFVSRIFGDTEEEARKLAATEFPGLRI